MKIKCLIFIFLSILILSCNKGFNNNSYLLNFNLNNAYVINNSDTILIVNGYTSDSIYNSVPALSSNIFLNDGIIGDTLTISCGNWSYLQNPNTTVEIWFPNDVIIDGIYNYDNNNLTNDFFIQIKNNIIFDSISGTSYNTISSYKPIAMSHSIGFTHNDSLAVQTAVIQVKNSAAENSEVRYHVETLNGDLIKGCYIGNLENFKYKYTECDCD